jgi:hypothetical protein
MASAPAEGRLDLAVPSARAANGWSMRLRQADPAGAAESAWNGCSLA